MNSRFKIIAIIAVIVIILIMIIFFFFNRSLSGVGDATRKEYKIEFYGVKETIYVEAGVWGLMGDHIQISFSNSSAITQRGYDSTMDYIFYEPTIYYKQSGDTLVIYTGSLSDVPQKLKTNIIIKQVQIKGYDEGKKYEETYKDIGLKKISVYEK